MPKSEQERDYTLAQEFWIRVLAASSADLEAIERSYI